MRSAITAIGLCHALALALVLGNSPTASAQAAITAAVTDEGHDYYPARLVHLISYHTRYPSNARLRRQEGRVYVGFILRPSGHVSDVRVLKSSGVPSLDGVALGAVKRASPFPHPPDKWKNRRFILPIRFYL